MNEKTEALQTHLALAAREALEAGGEDARTTIELFKKKTQLSLALPSRWLPGEDARFQEAIRLLSLNKFATLGEPTPDFASAVALGKGPAVNSFGASGVLVSPDVVLTAAHCVDDELTGGAWTYDGTRPESLGGIVGFLHHSKWGEPNEHQNDIGLIRLEQPRDDVEIYPIASTQTIDAATKLRIVGFGHDWNGGHGADHKTTADVHVRMNPSDGSVGFAGWEFIIGDPINKLDGDACEGDSGAPVLVEVDGRHQLAGIVSRSVEPDWASCGDGSICLRLDRYADWIDDTIEDLGGQKRPLA